MYRLCWDDIGIPFPLGTNETNDGKDLFQIEACSRQPASVIQLFVHDTLGTPAPSNSLY